MICNRPRLRVAGSAAPTHRAGVGVLQLTANEGVGACQCLSAADVRQLLAMLPALVLGLWPRGAHRRHASGKRVARTSSLNQSPFLAQKEPCHCVMMSAGTARFKWPRAVSPLSGLSFCIALRGDVPRLQNSDTMALSNQVARFAGSLPDYTACTVRACSQLLLTPSLSDLPQSRSQCDKCV